ncbi:hypothetical protein [Streptacidiphilus griseoplanus]|uniref:hypothetical protein n=1 Tax=Peterkaempfera griseoplana TaxID=66896 RepID=UPI000AD11A6F|nr:hypothetical protein [Peterkaempfera griseoplana]
MAGWALLHGGFALVCALTGVPLLYRATEPGPVGLDWLVVAVASCAAATVAAEAWKGARPGTRLLLRTACALSAVSAFGLLMDMITLAVSQRVDSAVAAVNHALGMLGVVVLGAASRSGASRGPTADRGSSVAPRRIRLAAYLGTAAFVPYAAMKATWALGGTFAGLDGAQVLAISRRNGASGLWLTLESKGLDATALLAVLGVLLLFGLTRPWGLTFPRWTPVLHGRRVPRWLPLAPALVGAATLAPYGVIGAGYLALGSAGVLTVPRGDFPTESDTLLVSWIGIGAFAVYGVALLLAARSYWLRTRPAAV